jgi:hypothetical protein
MKMYFDNTVEKDSASKQYTGKLVFEIVKNIEVVFEKGTIKGQKRKKTPTLTDISFKKQSIFFKYLPHWKDLQTCHNIDLMHVTKNVFDSIIRTLRNMPRKSKDGLKSHTDLVQFELRPELHPISRPNGKYFLPPASYTLTTEEKKTFYQCLRRVRVPMGFSFNISKLVSMNDLSMYSYNSYDYHVMMMGFLAIAIQAIKLVHVKVIITLLCYFFNIVSQKVIGRKELDDLRAYMIETMCMFEMCFPPSFFDMQQHLMIHLVDQIHILGLLYLHSMFPYERYLAILKSYVRNHAHPKGSIMEGYTTEEVVECCVDYVKNEKIIGLSISLHEGRLRGRGRMGQKSFVDIDYNSISEAYFSVLQQLNIATPYIEEHLSELHRDNIGRTEA